MKKNWQIRMSMRSLKKKEKIKEILKFLKPTTNIKCLEVGCDKGVTSFFLRTRGGDWSSADTDEQNVKDTKEIVDKNVFLIDPAKLLFDDSSFDCIIAIDFLEHISQEETFLKEVNRILRPDGKFYITVPNADNKKLSIRNLRELMSIYYGHVKEGYSLTELQEMLNKAGFKINRVKTFCRFFTQFIELLINFVYVFILNKNKATAPDKWLASPASSQDFKKHSFSFMLYTFIYPLLWLISQLDKLIWFTNGYILILETEKI